MRITCEHIGAEVTDYFLLPILGFNTLFFISEDQVLWCFDEVKGRLLYNKECINLFVDEGLLLIWEKTGETRVLNEYKNIDYSVGYWVSSQGGQIAPAIYYIYPKGNGAYLAHLKKSDYSIIESYKIPASYRFSELVSSDAIVGFNFDEIECYNFKEGSVVWQHKWEAKGSAPKVSYSSQRFLHEGKLYFSMKPDGYENSPYLCRVDVSSGKVETLIEAFPLEIRWIDGIIYGVGLPATLYSYDLESKALDKTDFKDTIMAAGLHEINYWLWDVQGSELSFYQSHGSHNAIVGLLDISSKELLCMHKFPAKHGFISSMRRAGDSIYCLMQDKTLFRISIER